jgi:ribonuclease P protein component
LIQNKGKEDFNRKGRVRRREDFQRLLREGRRVHSWQYSLVVVENGMDFMRLGLSIRKGVGSAVNRNYEKRLCREFFRRESIGQKKGYDVLIIIKHRSESFQKSYRGLQDLFQRSLK